ncbi:GNAT family N-acetyltransferase [Lacinutrix sp. WUR7]|uniref:GNAT family N-acetyltransferase n=1 Tax=Lacinutrix sp. WUR7 TaxID=2653681 RepID=UPI00193CE720|nr:GNAT family N-acetyltransferase [Lacinutrix sp. WUR7]QRM90919.1 GNAT family N-acetyltransferase [Lacinutrix sp. WUR7]
MSSKFKKVRNSNIIIREIEQKDNAQIEAAIRWCFHEYEIPLVGTAYEDAETPRMFESYQNKNEVYYVVELDGKVFGGAGIQPLKDFETEVCEIQKMYFAPEVRGKGIGKPLFEKCMEAAKAFGYKQCYLETIPNLKAAIHIYETFGFKHLEAPLGNTGHNACGIWMLKNL